MEEKATGPLELRLKSKKWKDKKEAFEELGELFAKGDDSTIEKYSKLMLTYLKENNASIFKNKHH